MSQGAVGHTKSHLSRVSRSADRVRGKSFVVLTLAGRDFSLLIRMLLLLMLMMVMMMVMMMMISLLIRMMMMMMMSTFIEHGNLNTQR